VRPAFSTRCSAAVVVNNTSGPNSPYLTLNINASKLLY
jgi:hypothetical protein